VLDRDVAAADTSDLKRKRVLMLDLNKITDVKNNSGDTDGALTAIEESVSITRDLAKASDNISTRRDVSIALEKLGNVKLSAGDKPAALAAYEEMLSIDRRAAEEEADNLQRFREEMYSLNKVGDTRLNIGDPSGALAYQEGLSIARKLLAADPDNDQAKRDVSYSLEKVGDARSKAGDVDGALAAFEEELAIRTGLAKVDGANVDAKTDLVVALYKIAEIANGDKKDKAIDQGLALLADLDADGKLTDVQKGWKDYFLSLRKSTSQ
jgi:tetratricopeptide (TPR) repeat protein